MQNNSIEPVATTAERLKEALEHRHLSAAELCRRTGISSASMSQYITGKVTPKQDRIYILALHLNVRPAWLMGFDIDAGFNSFKSSRQRQRLEALKNQNYVDPVILDAEFGDIDRDVLQYQKLDRLSKIKSMYLRVDAETQIDMLNRINELYDLYRFKNSTTSHEGNNEEG